MKKRNIVVYCLAFLMLIATFAFSQHRKSLVKVRVNFIDDSVITTKVKALLAKDDLLKSFQISVETYQGTVQLSGFVNSQKAVDKAGSIYKECQRNKIHQK